MSSDRTAEPMNNHSFDLVVCGGGTAGSAAAIRAARLGLSVALLERQSQLGGSATAALVTPVMPNAAAGTELVAGIHRQLHDELTRLGVGEVHGFDPVWAAIVLERWAAEAGVRLFYHTELIGVRKNGPHLAAVQAAALGKRFEVRGRYFIDATGDALVANFAGEPVRMGREETGEHQPMSLRFIVTGVDVQRVTSFFRDKSPESVWPRQDLPGLATYSLEPQWLTEQAKQTEALARWQAQLTFSFYTIPGRPDALCFNAPRVFCTDPTDAARLADAYVDGRRQIVEYWRFFRQHVPGFKHSRIETVAPLIGMRECRRIEGRFVLCEQHVRNLAKFDDTICRCNYPIDIHHAAGDGTTLWYLPADAWYEIPYRALQPQHTTNLLVAGRCISTDFVAHSSYRIIPVCRGLGEAAAYACAMAKAANADFNEVDGRQLSRRLQTAGLMPAVETST